MDRTLNLLLHLLGRHQGVLGQQTGIRPCVDFILQRPHANHRPQQGVAGIKPKVRRHQIRVTAILGHHALWQHVQVNQAIHWQSINDLPHPGGRQFVRAIHHNLGTVRPLNLPGADVTQSTVRRIGSHLPGYLIPHFPPCLGIASLHLLQQPRPGTGQPFHLGQAGLAKIGHGCLGRLCLHLLVRGPLRVRHPGFILRLE